MPKKKTHFPALARSERRLKNVMIALEKARIKREKAQPKHEEIQLKHEQARIERQEMIAKEFAATNAMLRDLGTRIDKLVAEVGDA